jgi:hypothetical protein
MLKQTIQLSLLVTLLVAWPTLYSQSKQQDRDTFYHNLNVRHATPIPQSPPHASPTNPTTRAQLSPEQLDAVKGGVIGADADVNSGVANAHLDEEAYPPCTSIVCDVGVDP